MIYVVRCGEDVRCAKVNKEANLRSFRQSVGLHRGRKVKKQPPRPRHGKRQPRGGAASHVEVHELHQQHAVDES